MDQSLMMKQRELTDRFSRYCYEYYSAGAPSVSDAVYDRLFDELAALEQNTGIQLAGSPTVNVGFPVAEKLEKTSHEIPLLSMEKVKSSEELHQFIGDRQVMFMLKLDGLTIKLTYENGELVEAATRGDGDVGQVVTHNARSIRGIPAHISYQERLVVAGEAFIRPRDFEELKTSATDGNGETYKNGRNLAAGSIQLLDSKECFKRRLTFMPFQVLEGYADLPRKSDRLYELGSLGFCPCKFMVSNRTLRLEEIEDGINRLRTYARDYDIPIDGIVVTYNDVPFAKSCGRTRHHYKDSLAFKFKDEMYETVLQSIEWTPGRTGEIAPVAVFRPVTMEGCQVCRASLHNLSFIENLQLMPGNRILVSKRNIASTTWRSPSSHSIGGTASSWFTGCCRPWEDCDDRYTVSRPALGGFSARRAAADGGILPGCAPAGDGSREHTEAPQPRRGLAVRSDLWISPGGIPNRPPPDPAEEKAGTAGLCNDAEPGAGNPPRVHTAGSRREDRSRLSVPCGGRGTDLLVTGIKGRAYDLCGKDPGPGAVRAMPGAPGGISGMEPICGRPLSGPAGIS